MSPRKTTTNVRHTQKDEVMPSSENHPKNHDTLAKAEEELDVFEEETPKNLEECVESSLHAFIEKKAYQLFIERGGEYGDDWRDWFLAEEEIKQNLE